MSMTLTLYAGVFQEKPTVEVRSESGSYWINVSYDSRHALTFHGRSEAQCERLAAAWLAMWDEPATAYEPLKPAEIVPMAGGGNMTRAELPDYYPEDTFERMAALHPEDGQPLDDAGLADELDDTTQEEISK